MNHELGNPQNTMPLPEELFRVVGDRVMRVVFVEPENPEIVRQRDGVQSELTGIKRRATMRKDGTYRRLATDSGSDY